MNHSIYFENFTFFYKGLVFLPEGVFACLRLHVNLFYPLQFGP